MMASELDRFEWLRKVAPAPSRVAHAFSARPISLCGQLDLDAREHCAFPGHPIKWAAARHWKRQCVRCVAAATHEKPPPKARCAGKKTKERKMR
jgi:hypothetical protein